MPDLTPVEIVSSREPWSEYLLADGTLLRLRCIVTRVSRNDEAPMPDGKPNYEWQYTFVSDVQPGQQEIHPRVREIQ